MLDKQGLIMLGTVMMWGCRLLCIQDVVLFSIYGVKYYNESGILNILLTLGFFGFSLLFLVMGEKFNKKILKLKTI